MVFKFLSFHIENKFSIVRNEIPNNYNNLKVSLNKSLGFQVMKVRIKN
jgi:hypothetical protein